MIEAELARGNVQESFHHLKGWYRAASETTTRPCPQTMVKKMVERINLYRQQDPPGEPLPINIDPIPVDDGTPSKGKIRVAAAGLSNGRAGVASGMRAEDVKAWLHGIKLEEDPEVGPVSIGARDNWRRFTLLVQAIWDHGEIPPQLQWVIIVLIPKGEGDYWGIGLLETMWKVCKHVMDLRLNAFDLHDSLHGCRDKCGTRTAGIEAKLAQQLAHLEQVPFYGVFLDLKKVFDSMDRERCLLILEGYRVGPRVIRLIQNFWRNAVLVCRASGNYGSPFCAGHGVTQGGPLSAKLFNIFVDAVAREWVRQLQEESELEEAVITELMAAFFAIFYVDDTYLALRDPEFLQRALDILADLFAHVGLKTNVKKIQTMICMPRRIQTQLPAASYARMREGLTTAEEWDSWKVQCHQCNKMMAASSLCRHLADQHEVYQQVVVVEELLGAQVGVTYHVHSELGGGLKCPVSGCAGKLRGGWLLVVVSTEGYFLQCGWCAMQVNPAYPRHIQTQECHTRVERKLHTELAVHSALALRRQFSVHGYVLECIKVFKYLGCLLAQDDNNAQAIQQQLQKARGVWAHVGQVLCGENTAPRIAAKFYKAVVQAALLYGSRMWNLTNSALARLKGFHICAAYKMARKHRPKMGANGVWVYLKTADILEECGMATIAAYIRSHHQTIAVYVATRPVFKACMEGKRGRGSMPHQWWWEQPMCLDAINATGSDANDGHLDAPAPADA
jgi:hypothetical protein